MFTNLFILVYRHLLARRRINVHNRNVFSIFHVDYNVCKRSFLDSGKSTVSYMAKKILKLILPQAMCLCA